jgi:hypothetical protein
MTEHLMAEVSRRQFLRNASVGAAAAGLVAVVGPRIITGLESPGGMPLPSVVAAEEAVFDGADVFARIVDARAGHIRLFVGTKAVDYTNPALAQELLRAVQ